MSAFANGVGLDDRLATLGAAVLDVSVQAAVVVAVAGVVAAVARRAPARWRHGVWVVALLACAALPVFRAVLGHTPLRVGSDLALLGGAIWAAGAGALLARAALQSWRLGALRRGAVRAPGLPPWALLADVTGPVTFGWRPIVLLPRDFGTWPADQQRQALLHESAHIARHDWAIQRATTLLTCLAWFHPPLWVARAHLALEAERAADEAVLGAGERPSDYAQLLLSRAGQMPHPALSAKRGLEIRIRGLLAGPRSGGAITVLGLLGLLALPPLLSGLTVAPEAEAVHCEIQPPPDVGRDTARAAPYLNYVANQVETLGETELAHLQAAADQLVRNCPYNRAGAGLPEVMDEFLAPHFDLLGREDLASASPALAARLG